MPEPTASTSRRRASPSKGDLRERAILDSAERQLIEDGSDGVTFETIATSIGITRGAVYFYFGSRNDVLAALVERTAASVVAEVERADAVAASDPRQALRDALCQTARLWSEGGAVMRMAVELSPSVPEIAARWQAAISATATATRRTLVRAGMSDDDGPTGAQAISSALVSMTERYFYGASKRGASLDETASTLTYIWLATLPSGPPERPERSRRVPKSAGRG